MLQNNCICIDIWVAGTVGVCVCVSENKKALVSK